MHLEQFLRQRLQSPLPGIEAHRELMPPLPGNEQRLGNPPRDARRSAVIVPLLINTDGLPHVLFTLRSDALTHHRGQISFPGGRVDEGETDVDAAVRELHEEVGITIDSINVLGQLSSIYIPPSRSIVSPIVALVPPQREYQLSQTEVTEVFDVPLTTFLDPTSMRYGQRAVGDLSIEVPQWHIHPTVPLWGATAMMLNELVWLTREYLAWSQQELQHSPSL